MTEMTTMARNADAMQIESGRERLNALLGLVPRASSDCNKSGALLGTMMEFEKGASVGKSPTPMNSVLVVTVPVMVVVPVLLATVAVALVLDGTTDDSVVPDAPVATVDVTVH